MRVRNRKKAFSLVEILIVIAIMAIVIGVVGSLLAGYTRMFNETDDHAVARQRAQDVFNALEVSVVNCALGIPTDTMAYFGTAPVASWLKPLEIKDTAAYGMTNLLSGNVLRIVYSIPSGIKNGNTRVSAFMPPATGTPEVTLTLTAPLSGDMVAMAGNPNDTRRYIAFPNAYTSTLEVTEANNTNQIKVKGRPQPPADATANPDLARLVRGQISPYQDIHFVRAIAAYVDKDSVFHVAEVNETDVSALDPTNTLEPGGFRVEGIKAVRFEMTADRRLLTVNVLAEGDIIDQTRKDSTLTRNDIKARWPAVTNWDNSIFYTDFDVTWRIRNYAPN